MTPPAVLMGSGFATALPALAGDYLRDASIAGLAASAGVCAWRGPGPQYPLMAMSMSAWSTKALRKSTVAWNQSAPLGRKMPPERTP